MDNNDIINRFRYHKPDEAKGLQHQIVREQLLELALDLNTRLPEGREKSFVITHLEEAMMWSNAAIARHDVR